MGTFLSHLTHGFENLLHHADWETSTYVHTTVTFKKTIFSEVNRDLLNFMSGNSSKDSK